MKENNKLDKDKWKLHCNIVKKRIGSKQYEMDYYTAGLEILYSKSELDKKKLPYAYASMFKEVDSAIEAEINRTNKKDKDNNNNNNNNARVNVKKTTTNTKKAKQEADDSQFDDGAFNSDLDEINAEIDSLQEPDDGIPF